MLPFGRIMLPKFFKPKEKPEVINPVVEVELVDVKIQAHGYKSRIAALSKLAMDNMHTSALTDEPKCAPQIQDIEKILDYYYELAKFSASAQFNSNELNKYQCIKDNSRYESLFKKICDYILDSFPMPNLNKDSEQILSIKTRVRAEANSLISQLQIDFTQLKQEFDSHVDAQIYEASQYGHRR